MSGSLERQRSANSLVTARTHNLAAVSRPARRALAALEEETLLRVAEVQADGYVDGERMKEIDHLSRTAMSGQAMVRRWSDTLAAGDPFLADELKFYGDLARMGKGEIIAGAIDRNRRQ